MYEIRNDLICSEKTIKKYIQIFRESFLGITKMNEEMKLKSLNLLHLRGLISHLQENTDLQNIDLMNLAGFCRNCLSKWMVEEAEKMDITLDYEKVRSDIYGMDYKSGKKNIKSQLNK